MAEAWAVGALAGAAAVGAPARYLTDAWVQTRLERVLPWGTLVVNVAGSLLFGILTGLAVHHGMSRSVLLVVGTGFCGAFTTFSTFAFESVRLAEDGSVLEAGANVVVTIVATLLAAGVGLLATASWS